MNSFRCARLRISRRLALSSAGFLLLVSSLSAPAASAQTLPYPGMYDYVGCALGGGLTIYACATVVGGVYVWNKIEQSKPPQVSKPIKNWNYGR
jgi:hypothetical protein